MKNDLLYLKSILDAINRIAEDRHAEAPEGLIFRAIVYDLATIGEAASKISQDTKKCHPHIAWRKIIAARNVFIHEYLGVQDKLVWSIVDDHLPALRKDISALIPISFQKMSFVV